MTAYYNEYDPFAAAWLRELIKAGHIAPGDVDERSIEDVCPDELAGYVQCHFFAGIGVWSHALRLAGWDDNREIWTGSCPCQPFSAAGKGAGFDDERHLWPAFFELIQQCNPAIVIGEQVASKDGLAWLDLVSADVEGTGRSFAAADLCAAGFGAPHIRQRSFWVAHGDHSIRGAGAAGWDERDRHDARWSQGPGDAEGRSSVVRLADLPSEGRGPERAGIDATDGDRAICIGEAEPGRRSATSGVANNGRQRLRGRQPRGLASTADRGEGAAGERERLRPDVEHGGARGGFSHNGGPPINGFWSDADWLGCRDGKWRPVEPGTFPLAHGATNRVGRLRGYGNAIVAPVAQAFIESVMEIC